MKRKAFVVVFLALLLNVMAVVRAQSAIIDTLLGNPDFSTLTQAFKNVDGALLASLGNGDSYTVLALTNDAFRRLSDYVGIPIESIIGNSRVATAILSYHIVVGRYTVAELRNQAGSVLPTLLPTAFVQVNRRDDGTVRFNNVGDIVRGDIVAGNSLIHVIDDGLLNRVINDLIESDLRNATATPVATEASLLATPNPEATISALSNVRFANFARGVSQLVIQVNGRTIIQELPYGQISEYVALSSSTSRVDFSDMLYGNVALSVPDLAIPPNTYLTVLLKGDVQQELETQLIENEYSALPEGQSAVSVYHAVPSGQNVAVLLDDEVVTSDLAFAQLATASIPSNVYQPRVIATDAKTDLVSLQRISLWDGSYYLMVIIPSDTEDGFQVAIASLSKDKLAQLDRLLNR